MTAARLPPATPTLADPGTSIWTGRRRPWIAVALGGPGWPGPDGLARSVAGDTVRLLANGAGLMSRSPGPLVLSWGLDPLSRQGWRDARQIAASATAGLEGSKAEQPSVSIACGWATLDWRPPWSRELPHVAAPILTRLIDGRRRSGEAAKAEDADALDAMLRHLDVAASTDRLGSSRDVMAILASAGLPLAPLTLATLLGATVAQTERSLRRLQRHGLAGCESRDGEAVWRSGPSPIAQALQSETLERDRIRLHRLAAVALSAEPRRHHGTTARRIAEHLEAAADEPGAFRAWLSAADDYSARSDNGEALHCLRRAVALSEAAPSRTPVASAVDARARLAALLGAVHGNGAEVVKSTYLGCAELLRTGGRKPGEPSFELWWGMQVCELVRGNIDNAARIAEQLRSTAEQEDDRGHRVVAARVSGLTSLLSGDLSGARRWLATTLELYRPDCDAELRFRFSSDQRALALAALAWTEAIAGRCDLSGTYGNAALAAAAELAHAHTSAHVCGVLAVAALLSGDRRQALAQGEAARSVATAHQLAYWQCWADIVIGSSAQNALPLERANRIAQAIRAYRSTGARQALPMAHLLLGEALLDAGRPSDADVSIRTGLRCSRQGAASLYRPELLRLAGRTMFAWGGTETQAIPSISQAYHSASRIGADRFAGLAIETLLTVNAGTVEGREAILSGLRTCAR